MLSVRRAQKFEGMSEFKWHESGASVLFFFADLHVGCYKNGWMFPLRASIRRASGIILLLNLCEDVSHV